MNSAKGLHVVLSLLVIVILASGCQGQTTVVNAGSTATPTPTSPPIPTLGQCNSTIFPGHLLLDESTGIHKLTCTPTGTVQDQVIVTMPVHGYGGVSISPDRRFLRYHIFTEAGSTSFQIVSQDLRTGAQHTYKISGDDTGCVSWSPSSTQVSYIAHNALVVENLITGAQRVLVQESSQNYSIGGTPGGLPSFGQVDCGAWISDDILLFHRFTGPFPQQITEPGEPELAPNTTTLAFLRHGTLVDTAGASLSVIALSEDGAYVLLADSTDGSWKSAKASAFTSFAAARPISCAGIHCTLIGFVPRSNEVYGFQFGLPSSEAYNEAYKGLVFVDPKNLAVQLGPIGLPANTTIYADSTGAIARLEVIQWGGIPDNAIVVYEFSNASENQDYIAATSLGSGEVDWLIDDSSGNQLLGWIS